MAGQRPECSLSVGTKVAVTLFGALALTVVLRGLYSFDGNDTRVFTPAVAAGLCLGGQLWYVSHRLLPSGTAGDPLVRLFGLANTLTLLRGALYAVVAGFVVVPPDVGLSMVPALAYGGGVVLDKLDGTVARTVGRETALGERLDMAFDTFGFVAAPLVAVLWGRLPVWYLSLSVARYVYRGGLTWRKHRGRPLFDPPDSDLGKYLAGVQMVFLTVALTPAVPAEFVQTAAPFVLAPSLSVFVRDFLVATGRLSDQEQ